MANAKARGGKEKKRKKKKIIIILINTIKRRICRLKIVPTYFVLLAQIR